MSEYFLNLINKFFMGEQISSDDLDNWESNTTNTNYMVVGYVIDENGNANNFINSNPNFFQNSFNKKIQNKHEIETNVEEKNDIKDYRSIQKKLDTIYYFVNTLTNIIQKNPNALMDLVFDEKLKKAFTDFANDCYYFYDNRNNTLIKNPYNFNNNLINIIKNMINDLANLDQYEMCIELKKIIEYFNNEKVEN